MLVGVGTGCAANFAVERVGELRDITFIPTIIATQKLAESFKIPRITLLPPWHLYLYPNRECWLFTFLMPLCLGHGRVRQ